MEKREIPQKETKRKSKKKKLNWLRIILATLLIALVVWVTYFIYQTNKNGVAVSGFVPIKVSLGIDNIAAF